MDYLLDTTAVISRLNGEQDLEDFLLRNPGTLYVPSIVFGEAYFGAENSIRIRENIAKIDEFAAEVTILDCDFDTSKLYGIVRFRLKKRGRPLNNDNDYWIASIALQHNLTLLTRDSDFGAVDGLAVVGW